MDGSAEAFRECFEGSLLAQAQGDQLRMCFVLFCDGSKRFQRNVAEMTRRVDARARALPHLDRCRQNEGHIHAGNVFFTSIREESA